MFIDLDLPEFDKQPNVKNKNFVLAKDLALLSTTTDIMSDFNQLCGLYDGSKSTQIVL